MKLGQSGLLGTLSASFSSNSAAELFLFTRSPSQTIVRWCNLYLFQLVIFFHQRSDTFNQNYLFASVFQWCVVRQVHQNCCKCLVGLSWKNCLAHRKWCILCFRLRQQQFAWSKKLVVGMGEEAQLTQKLYQQRVCNLQQSKMPRLQIISDLRVIWFG